MNGKIQIFIYSLLLYLIIIPLRGGYITIFQLTKIPLCLLVGSIFQFILTYFLIKKYHKKLSTTTIIILLILGTIILELPFRIIHFESTLISLPDSIFRIIAILFAALCAVTDSKIRKIIVITAFLSLSLWISYSGINMWFNKMSYGTYNGIIKQEIKSPIIFQKTDGTEIKSDDLKGEYIILDFWYSECGICLKEFPKVQKLHEQLTKTDKIKLYSVFCRLTSQNETPQTGMNILNRNGYSFPVISIDLNNPILKQIGVNYYPTVIILYKNKEIVFRGDIMSAINYIRNYCCPIKLFSK